jgi:hypothetical protein
MVSKPRLFAALLSALSMTAGCVSGPPTDSDSPEADQPVEQLPVVEYLDEQTGATVSAVRDPLIFARDRSERAANLRDYVTLVAAAVNRGGKRDYVLIAYIWSTLDPRYEPAKADADALVLVADDRRIRLTANGRTPGDLGISRAVDAPPGQHVTPLVFPTDLAAMRFIAAAHSLQVQTRVAESAVSYELWEDQRPALERFVRHLDGER